MLEKSTLKLTHVGGLSARSSRHIQHTLSFARRQGHHGQKRRCRLDHILTSEIFGSRTDRDGSVVNDKSDFRPRDGFEVGATVDEGLGKVASTCTKGVGADGYRSWDFIRLKEFDQLYSDENR